MVEAAQITKPRRPRSELVGSPGRLPRADGAEPDPLPPTTLRDADGVIASRLREIRDARAHHRAERVPLDEHFTAEELEALQVAFSRVDEAGAGALDLDQMRSAFLQVGMEPTDEEIAMVITIMI